MILSMYSMPSVSLRSRKTPSFRLHKLKNFSLTKLNIVFLCHYRQGMPLLYTGYNGSILFEKNAAVSKKKALTLISKVLPNLLNFIQKITLVAKYVADGESKETNKKP